MSEEQQVVDGKTAVDGKAAAGEGETLTFDKWLTGLPDEQKALIEGHTSGLKSALNSERESRKSLEKQLRELAGKAEKGSEQQAQINKLADDLLGADRKADFYEAAHAAGVKNLKLAFMAAQNDQLFDKNGRVNFDEMKKMYPELFAGGVTAPRGDAGSGTGKTNKPGATMNAFIRTAAGKRS